MTASVKSTPKDNFVKPRELKRSLVESIKNTTIEKTGNERISRKRKKNY